MYVREIVLNGIARFTLLLASFGFTFTAARVFRGESLDHIVLFQLTVTFTIAVWSFGLRDVVIREAASLEEDIPELSRVVVGIAQLMLLGLALSWLASLVGGPFRLNRWCVYGLYSGVLSSQVRLIIALFRGLGRLSIYLWLQGAVLATPYAVGVLYAVRGNASDDVLLSVTVGFVVAVLLCWTFVIVALRRMSKGTGRLFPPLSGTFLALLKRGRELYAQSLLGVLLFNADTAFLAAVAAPGIVGVYGVVSRLCNLGEILREVVALTMLPNIVRFMNDGDYPRLESYSRLIGRVVLMPLAGLLILGIVFSKQIVLLAFGGPVEKAALLFSILLTGHLGFALMGITDHLLIAARLEKYVLLAAVGSFSLLVVLGPIGLWLGGAVGLAIIVAIQRNALFLLGRRFLLRYGTLRIVPFGVVRAPTTQAHE